MGVITTTDTFPKQILMVIMKVKGIILKVKNNTPVKHAGKWYGGQVLSRIQEKVIHTYSYICAGN